MSADVTAIEQWVRAELAAARQTGIVDIGRVTAHPSRPSLACDVSVRDGVEADEARRVAIVDLDTSRCQVLGLGDAAWSPAWSPDGEQLAVLVSVEQVTTAWIVELSLDAPAADPVVVHRLPEVAGAVEELAWSPDGGRLGLVVAQFGAEVSDVYGSGTVQGPQDAESWRPVVSPSPESGRRVLHVWTPGDGAVDRLRPELNVWEAGWLGTDRLVVLASSGSGEGDWYAASLHTIDAADRAGPDQLYRSDLQLAQPRANPTGERWSVLVGRASDRGLLAGDLVVGDPAGARPYDTGDVDVTDHHWAADGGIVFAGIRGLATVFGRLDVETGTIDELLVTAGTNGQHQPVGGALTADGTLVVALERHDQPPTLTALRAGVGTEVVSTRGPGTAHLVSRSGSTTSCAWTSKDGWEIQGLLTVPKGPGPFPLVVNVHGGPVAAWLDGWIGKDYAALLVARGFAVLRPNPRGSAGRGQPFAEAVVGDVGGHDVDDVVTGVAAMIERGVTEPGRVGITGNSYGGYLAAWVPCWSDVFSAAVSRSPVTDLVSQHLTSNLGDFDEIFVGGDPFDPESAYTTRSPLTHHHRIRTPMLFTAGAHDLATPASQAQMLHRALQEKGVPTQLAVYPEEGHGVRSPDALADQVARMIAWFETHLKGPSRP